MLRGVFVERHVWALSVLWLLCTDKRVYIHLIVNTILSFVMGTNVLRRLSCRLRNEA